VLRVEVPRRHYWTSPTDIKTEEDVAAFAKSPAVRKSGKIMIPDFASIGRMQSNKLLELVRKYYPPQDLQLIIASSNNSKDIDYDQLVKTLVERPDLDSTLVVKGSGYHALRGDPYHVHQQYKDTISAVRSAGGKLMLSLRIDLNESVVLWEIEKRLKLGARGLVTHPVFNVPLVSPQVIKVLSAIVREHPGFKIRIGTLWATQDLYARLKMEGDEPVTQNGLDQYPMPPAPVNGDWETWNRRNLEDIRNLANALGLRQPPDDTTYTRVGLGHSDESVMKIATVIEETSQELEPVASEGEE
jgi:hypothetical protein